jgi:hypothetical protein
MPPVCLWSSRPWRRTAAWGAAELTVYYTLFVVILMNGRLLLTDYAVFVTYENIAMQLAIAAGGLIVYAATAKIDGIDAALSARLRAWADWRSGLVRWYSAQRILSI